MGQTALQLVQAACYEANIPAPSALVSQTDTSTLQLLHLFYSTGRELRASRCWDQLKRQHSIILQSGQRTYDLPQDYHTYLPATEYDSRNTWRALGSQSDSLSNEYRYGRGTTGVRIGFRVIGSENANDGRGQIELDTVPGDADAGERITFDYITKSWLSPPLWTAGETVAQNIWRTSFGRNYKKTDSGSEAGDVIAPNMAYGIGQDNGVIWRYVSVSSWSSSTTYKAGAYVSNGGNYYKCTTTGLSAASGGPSGTSTGIEDNTCAWDYVVRTQWASHTRYEKGDFIYYASNNYVCLEPGTSNINTYYPRWTQTTVADNAITWTFQPQAYETLVTDSDLCHFDDELMIAGLKWRFLRARGLAYEDLLGEYEQMKDAAAARFNPGKILRLGAGRPTGGATVTDGGWNA